MGAPVPDSDRDSVSLASKESTYTSLIQQYLEIMCIDNAIFLAERLVAFSKTNHSLYLLALCYYRSGAPKRAQVVLEESSVTVGQGPAASHSHKKSPAMQYLLAKCYYDTDQFGPAEEALLEPCRDEYRSASNSKLHKDKGTPPETMEEWILTTTPCPIPNGAAGLDLLGKICRKSNRKQRAADYFRMALKLDPLMWVSFEALCELGCADDASEVFGVYPAAFDANANANDENGDPADFSTSPAFSLTTQTPMEGKALRPMELGTPSIDGGSAYLPKASLFHTTRKVSTAKRNAPPSVSSSRPPMSSHRQTTLFETPNLTPILRSDDKQSDRVRVHSNAGSTCTNPRVYRRARHVASRLYYPPSPESSTTTPSPFYAKEQDNRNVPSSTRFLSGLDQSHSAIQHSTSRLEFASDETPAQTPATPSGPDRLGIRSENFSQRQPRTLFPTSTQAASKSSSMLSTAAAADDDAVEVIHEVQAADPIDERESSEPTVKEDVSGVGEILETLCIMGAAQQHLCQYRCREALQIFHKLPDEQFHTGWVLHQVGRAYFEMADYQNAKKSLEVMQQMEPHRMKGLEVLSTALWHLKKEVELSHLAQRAVDFDRLSPESWCVVGNCFSLQKEHETALSFFRRSVQLDPTFTYSHTLSGHEFVANEDFDKAIACYRDAIRADERHYNAWYGLGAIYYRQEKYDLAEYHFKRALSINPQSSVLHCHLGMAQHANGKAYEALDTLTDAFRLDPRNPQARYQRATIYMALDRPHEALEELKKVRDAAPREASVHFAMGRVLKRVGRPEQAMKCFLTALDLDPKENNLIKAAMDKLDEPDIDEEVSAF